MCCHTHELEHPCEKEEGGGGGGGRTKAQLPVATGGGDAATASLASYYCQLLLEFVEEVRDIKMLTRKDAETGR